MQGLGWIAAIIVGGLAGWAASTIMKAKTGLLMNIILGIIGAIVANFLLRLVGITASPTWISQGIVGLIGGCLLIAGMRAIRR
ncbi:GlsB/YeaQ/YmgE family stress response membrane protein [Rhodophyticola sp. CCM32]|uniref:GlsB/YeaQ/YmgE family stress response membrane protein n=1 Tax=Rhodophyticola sp. CCM32 TaxID=2916397 RepID=UPI00107F8112|nr:GlsB/YeaQ/YmgE family stress response membrane protein [Rhodophyticola sp. CCM32]QBY02825.1 GlsB/YeaQ/YmgE family stress response membrane protein [Rhodophyticola sp. CCM32]